MKTHLQKLRLNAGYTSAVKFANAIGLKSDTYRNYENSSCRIPLDNAIKIADFLNCSLDDLVDRRVISNKNINSKVKDQEYVMRCYRSLPEPDKESINKYILTLSALS